MTTKQSFVLSSVIAPDSAMFVKRQRIASLPHVLVIRSHARELRLLKLASHVPVFNDLSCSLIQDLTLIVPSRNAFLLDK